MTLNHFESPDQPKCFQYQRGLWFWGFQIFLLCCSSSILQAALLWEFKTKTGGSGIVEFGGTFSTTGEYSDTQGSEAFEFEVLEFISFTRFGRDLTAGFDSPPSQPIKSSSRFEWNPDTQSVSGWEDSDRVLRGSDGFDFNPSVFTLAFPPLEGNDDGEGSGPTENFQLTDFDNNPSYSFTPSETTLTPLTPVPEVKEYATAVFGFLFGFIAWRRHKTGIPKPHRLHS